MDKEEAAVDLTRENAHRYKPAYYTYFCKLYFEKDQVLDIWKCGSRLSPLETRECLANWVSKACKNSEKGVCLPEYFFFDLWMWFAKTAT